MNRIIINADDCGYNKEVNKQIEKSIQQGRISSTTIMANMDDFEGATRLYHDYKEEISFGFHMNMTEGTPLTYSQELVDMGFYKEKDGIIVFDGNPFRRKILSSSARKAIYREVLMQAQKIQDSGIRLSHIDSHHFMHQAVFMLPLLPKLCQELKVYKVRNYRNYMPDSFQKSMRTVWLKLLKLQNPKILAPDLFVDYQCFYECFTKGIQYYKDNDTIELMCHPGGIYPEEDKLLCEHDCETTFKCKLVNYNEL